MWKYCFKAVIRDEHSGHDIIASMPLPPATWQLLTKLEIPKGVAALAGLFFSCMQVVSKNQVSGKKQQEKELGKEVKLVRKRQHQLL